MQLLSPLPTATDYRAHLQADLQGARLLRFVIAYVSEDGLKSIGQDLLVSALSQPDSFGVASLSCACGFAPLLGLQALLEPQEGKLKYFVDPVVLDTQGDPDLSLVHSKLVFIVRADGRAVVYLGSHNWSSRALGPDTPRNAEASVRVELDFDPAQLSGQGSDLASQVNRHLLTCFNYGASLPAHKRNMPVFADWYRARCEREKPLPLDPYAVVVGVCTTDGSANTYDHLWQAILTPGASIYLPCHVENEGLILRERQDRVLLMAWTSQESLEQSREPVLLFCKVTRQVAGQDSAFQGTSKGDIKNFDLVLHDPGQRAHVQAGDDPGDPLTTTLNNGQVFEHFQLSPVPAGVTAATIDSGATPKYQSYLQVYQVLLPEWLKHSEDPRAALARKRMQDRADQGVWHAAHLALTPNRQVQPEVSKNYRAPHDLRDQIIGCFKDAFGLHPSELRVRPVDPDVAPKELVRLAESPLHYGYIDDDSLVNVDEFYTQVRPGRLAPDLAPMQREPDEDAQGGVEPRVQQLYAERLREILENVGITDADLTAWEAKPPKRRTRTVDTVRLKLFDLGDPGALNAAVSDIRQRHIDGLTDFAFLKELFRLAVSVQEAGRTDEVGTPLLQHLFDDVRTPATGFFSALFVQSFSGLAAKHCPHGWPAETKARSQARRAVTQFIKSQALGDDRSWQLLCLEYLRGTSAGHQ